MTAANLALFALLLILLVAVAVSAWPRSARARFHDAYARWAADARRRGLTGPQMQQEFQFRHAMAALRRRASDAAIADPLHYQTKLVEIAAEEAKTLAIIDVGVAKRFVGIVDTAPLSDILYPDALDAVYRAGHPMPPANITDDALAALRHS